MRGPQMPQELPHVRPQMRMINGGGRPARNFVSAGAARVQPMPTQAPNAGGQIVSRLRQMYNMQAMQDRKVAAANRRAELSGYSADYEMDSQDMLEEELMRRYAQWEQEQAQAQPTALPPIQEPEPLYDLPDEDEEDDYPRYDYPRSYY